MKIFSFIFNFIFKEKLIAFQICACSFLINIFALAFSFFIILVYDKVIGNSSITTLYTLTTGIILILIFDLISKRLKSISIANVKENFDKKFGEKIFETFFESSRPSNLVLNDQPNLIKKNENFREILIVGIPILFVDIPFLVLFITIIYLLAGNLFLIPFLASILIIFTLIIIARKRHNQRSEVETTLNKKFSTYNQIFFNFLNLRFLPGINIFKKKWISQNNNESKNSTKLFNSSTIITDIIQISSQMCQILTVFFGSIMVLNGSLGFGILFGCIILTGRALVPLGNLSRLVSGSQAAYEGFDVINEIMSLKDKNQTTQLNHIKSVGLLKISFNLEEKIILKNINLQFFNKTKVGIIGQVGSGKTSLLNCISGKLKPKKGDITYNDINQRHISDQELGNKIGFLEQFPIMFDGTVIENILIGSKDQNEKSLNEVINKLSKYGLFDIIKNDLNLRLVSNGMNISGGQRKVIGLARALINNPEVVLFDEPTNSFDGHLENQFTHFIKNELNDNIVIISSHRADILKSLDRIIIIKDGTIVDDKPKDEILKNVQVR